MKPSALIRLTLIGHFLLLAGPSLAAAVTKNVPGDYATIQAAINAAANDPTNPYTIMIEPPASGSYPGGIEIIGHPNSLTLVGRETARTVLSGGGTGRLLHIANNNAGSIVIRNLLFRSAAEGVFVTGNSSTVTITNNVFDVGSNGAGVTVQSSPSARIIHNTFYRNGAAVHRDEVAIAITNNIFSGNITSIANQTDAAGITYNLFDPVAQALGTKYQPDNVLFTTSDPLFVNAGQRDFHVSSGSPVIDTGDVAASGLDSVDGTTPDMGAYGGPSADTIPFPVTSLTSSATSTAPYNISLGWQANTAYTIAGYRVYYGSASEVYTGMDAAEGPSPVDVAANSALLSNLSPTASAPAAPVLETPEPRNGSLLLKWSKASGATGYRVHWGTFSATENSLDVGDVTTYTLGGLTNLQTYLIRVSALSQATYYVAVTAYDVSGETRSPGMAHESDYSSPELTVRLGQVLESGLSNEKSGIPEKLSAYPALPDTGCFIATAAYGSVGAAPVRVLRDFRDRRLQTNAPGRALVRWYYRTSPALARYLNEHPFWKPFIRAALAPVVIVAFAATHALWLLVPATGLSLFVLRGRRRRRRAS